jgi:hypothetical protein
MTLARWKIILNFGFELWVSLSRAATFRFRQQRKATKRTE